MSAAKYAAVRHLIHLFESLPDDVLSAGSRSKLGNAFRSPIEVDRAFPVEAACPLAQDEDEMPVVDSTEGEKPDDLEKFCDDMERLGRSFADTLAGLYSGVYDSELKAVAANDNQMQTPPGHG